MGRYRVADRVSWNVWVNAYLVDTGETTLVDAGIPNAVDDLRGELDEAGYDAGEIDRVRTTHFDLDHAGTLAHLAFDGPFYAMEPDARVLDGSHTPPLSNYRERNGSTRRVGSRSD